RFARGKLQGDWEHHLFDDNPVLRRKLFNWSRFVLVGHATIFAVAMYMGWWVLPLLITFPMCFASIVHTLCNSSQHIGLRDNVPDFRLCCRTIYLNPFFQFLYWHMNYHTEHHMYAAVPCYKLPKLHRLIKHEMPPCPNGLRQTWTGIFAILEKQKADPTYQHSAPLPASSSPKVAVTAPVELGPSAEPQMTPAAAG
ncbi:MAG: fatty acid desaturase, partial [Tepidisphaeraceae bacterium]